METTTTESRAGKPRDTKQYLSERREITAAIKNEVIEVLNLDLEATEIGLDSPLFASGLGLDSIDAVGIAAMIETNFGVEVLDSDVQAFRSINTIVDFILARRAGGEGPGTEEGGLHVVTPESLAASEEQTETSTEFLDYVALRTGVGLIDYSSMAKLRLTGPGAFSLIDFVVAGNIDDLAMGELINSLILDERGDVSSIIWLLRDDSGYLVLADGARRPDLRQRLEGHRAGREVEITDQTEMYGILALVGPRAQDLMVDLFDEDLLRLGYGEYMDRDRPGTPVRILRIGETGEFDYRMLVAAAAVPDLLEQIREDGSLFGLRDCNAGVLPTLMLEMKSIDLATMVPAGCKPPELDLQWMVNGRKESFLGRQGFLDSLERPARRSLVLSADGDAGPDIGAGAEVWLDGRRVGVVQTAADSAVLAKRIYLAFVEPELALPGITFELRGGGRSLPAAASSAPLFLTRTVFESLNI
jgi:aminomethyltransferase